MKLASNKRSAAPVQLTWSHLGILYRVTAWPEVEFQAQRDGRWVSFEPNPASEVFAAAAVMLGKAEWKRYLEFVPIVERELIERYTWSRLSVLALVTRCPQLTSELEKTPALAAFIGSHAALRGTHHATWGEIEAVFERSGIFGVLDWLGLPAARRTLEALAALESPDVAKRLLEPLREALWNPALKAILRSEAPIREVSLAARLHRIAA